MTLSTDDTAVVVVLDIGQNLSLLLDHLLLLGLMPTYRHQCCTPMLNSGFAGCPYTYIPTLFSNERFMCMYFFKGVGGKP